ncbi:hypothetical protein Back11_58150 [Paenibacillus baekrokdamisoli]|uniref:Uncharacterized protein n=1 Tax=Paenibacillus baekrokdamisoli TaxID=1712516 RepID=A0A3G9IZX3_9BACL|nr:DUF4259 domain-containing protein [Paenibacillus baekrokdamisoli]MBB3071499.1 hypothetical protein [Paenibacillus baekrokdamisoli]BBH24470.1 hypothetical protein Back11_58150 [Paenibacillus baekrokdamisoli]
MGAWGTKTFDSDDTLDWMGEFLEAPTLGFLNETLSSAVEDDYIVEPYGSSALAAAEFIAALLGKTNGPLPEELTEAVTRFKPKKVNENVVALASKAVNKILENSELKELWEESDDYTEWSSNLQELVTKLV